MILSKLKLTIAAVVASLALATGAALVWQYRAIDRLKIEAHAASQRAEQAEAQVLAERRAKLAQSAARRKAEAKLKESNATLDQALKAAPDWAAEPVPPVVDDWLRDLYDEPASRPIGGLPLP